ncbi:MAG TPA: efflux RND transporter periplasmic adaptor subunit [Armatimonadota bacterium]|jgi:RND family efflux transporter MFP subunit
MIRIPDFKTLGRWAAAAIGLIALSIVSPSIALGGPRQQAGPYRVEVATDPAVIPVGSAKLLVRVSDADGNPVAGAKVGGLVKMASMDMGETEMPAAAVSGQPGVYEAPASFSMAGEFEATIRVSGPKGSYTARIPLHTGQDTGGLAEAAGAAAGPSPTRYLPRVLLLALAGFTVYRMRRTGQGLRWNALLHWQFLAGACVLVALYLVAAYAVSHWRRPGSMTPLEAQGMEMNTPAPPGVAPVDLATVTEGPVDSTVTYTGQAAGFYEQDVIARVRGVIVEMPYYIGDHVSAGEVIARLDTSELQPQVAEKAAMAEAARQGTTVARSEYAQALAAIGQARSEAAGKLGALRDARASLVAAQEDKAGARAMLTSARTQVADAQAQLDAAKADDVYWRAQIARTRRLQKAGAVSGEELQRDESSTQAAASKVRQALAMVAKVGADIRAAESASRKADAMIVSAGARISQTSDEADAARAQVRMMKAAADAARQRIAQAESGVAQAQANVDLTTAQRGFAVIRAGISGVISQHGPHIGSLMSPGQVIQRIVQVDPIRLQANVAEADLPYVHVGTPVTIRPANAAGRAVSAKVTSITPSLDPISRTGVVEAVLPNRDGRFTPGQYLVMNISVGRKAAALRIPTSAIHNRPPASGVASSTKPTAYVWLAEPSGPGRYTVHAVDVEVGLTGDAIAEITSGLKAGQRVVTTGALGLRDGDNVASAGTAAVLTPRAESTPAPSGSMPGMRM